MDLKAVGSWSGGVGLVLICQAFLFGVIFLKREGLDFGVLLGVVLCLSGKEVERCSRSSEFKISQIPRIVSAKVPQMWARSDGDDSEEDCLHVLEVQRMEDDTIDNLANLEGKLEEREGSFSSVDKSASTPRTRKESTCVKADVTLI